MHPNSVQARDARQQLHSYSNITALQNDGTLLISKGDGVYVEDVDGKRYLEAMAGLWSASLGFSEPRLAAAAHRQMSEVTFYHNFFGRGPDVTAELAEKLVSITPDHLNHVYFAGSGSEANDTAIKLIWYYNNALGRPEKKKILSRQLGYHGVTVAAASLTAIPINQMAFDLPIDRIGHLSCPHHWRFAEEGESEEDFATRLAEELEARILEEGPDTVAAFFAEPVLAAGGVVPPPRTYFEKVQRVLRKYDVLFVADEVVCGFWRTGNQFGSDTYDLKPDFMTLAKALSASSAPISALMMTDAIYDAIHSQSDSLGMLGHGYTYSGHPMPAAVALETLKIYEERDIGGHVKTVAPVFQERRAAMADHRLVGEARGVGLMGAVEMVANKDSKENFDPALALGATTVKMGLERGIILRAKGDAITLCPPLIISEAEVHELFDKLTDSMDAAALALGV